MNKLIRFLVKLVCFIEGHDWRLLWTTSPTTALYACRNCNKEETRTFPPNTVPEEEI